MERFTEQEKAVLAAKAAEIPEIIRSCVIRNKELGFPFLPAGSCYHGIWVEHNQDNLFITDIDPEAAWGSMEIFLHFQRADGLMPCCVDSTLQRVSFSQLQIVYPFARCALEVARRVGRPESDYARIYAGAARFDAWLEKFRDRSGKGLVEMFCEFDTGHDNSPRVTDGGIPKQCPGKESSAMPDLPCMPIAAADLSATRYGSLAALAELAELLDKPREAANWRLRAEELREKIFRYLFCGEDDYFYDLAPQGFRKYRTEHITRIFLNRVVGQKLFDRIYDRYFTNPQEFGTAYPFPAVAVSDPSFCKELPYNCWGCNTQMLTLLRLLLFMDDYRRSAELDHVLEQFLRAYLEHPENRYAQELNPFTGAPIGDSSFYMPAMLLMRESCRRFGIIR